MYAIDICAYAVMDNHYHVVLHVDKDRALAWSHEEVVERWMQLYKGDILVDQLLRNPTEIDKTTLNKVEKIIEHWRERLFGIDWFMRGVNETIARMANEEENCKGRFREGRYKSQALLDETALLSCMAYVDLNPIRAAKEKDLIESDFTSIQQRLFDYVKRKSNKNESEQKLVANIRQQRELKKELALDDLPEAKLMPFDGSSHTSIHNALPFTRQDFFELVDTTRRAIREGKRGFIPSEIPLILSRFNIDPDSWVEHIVQFEQRFGRAVGSREKLREFAQKFTSSNYRAAWCKGMGAQRRLRITPTNTCALN